MEIWHLDFYQLKLYGGAALGNFIYCFEVHFNHEFSSCVHQMMTYREHFLNPDWLKYWWSSVCSWKPSDKAKTYDR